MPKQGSELTRSRAYRKNDQAWAEQKNGAIVRQLAGYGRFGGAEATAALVRLYDSAWLHVNLFQPSFKCIGARVIKRYHPPVPPIERVLAHLELAEIDKERLRAMLATADPVMLFTAIRAAQEDLGRRVDRRGAQIRPEEPVVIDLHQTRFTNKSLRAVQMAVKAWRQESALEILNGDWMTPVLPPAKSFGNILR